MFLQQLENPYDVEEEEEKTDCPQLISILKIKQTLIIREEIGRRLEEDDMFTVPQKGRERERESTQS
jgi:hypothetical protein